ncbi:signal peptidase I [Kineococcus sp. SYSU DK018]|uniref:signal peptidase I n=1 Tax=Kineococcus sp. SYSU DK018 TaxID=3383139 RepID=UPI003D7EC7D5
MIDDVSKVDPQQQSDDGSGPPPKRSTAGSLAAAVREVVLVVAVALVVSLVVKTFLLQAFFIPSQSMEQTLDIGDRVVVGKLAPGLFALHRGDVVVFSDPGGWLPPSPPAERGPVGAAVAGALMFVGLLPEDSDEHLIKRVIGLPGDHVASDGQGAITVNDIPIDESDYLAAGVAPSEKPFDVTAPADRLWVMGDNRPQSADSREHRCPLRRVRARGGSGGARLRRALAGRALGLAGYPGRLRRRKGRIGRRKGRIGSVATPHGILHDHAFR